MLKKLLLPLFAFLLITAPAVVMACDPPVPPTVVTLLDDGKRIHLNLGQTFLLQLGEGYDWKVQIGNKKVLSKTTSTTAVASSTQGEYKAIAQGTSVLTALGSPTCRKSVPACGAPARNFTITIQVSLAKMAATAWQRIATDSFTLSVPPTWKFNKLQGIDSYVGEFVGDGARLSFDFGQYSSSLAAPGDQNYTISYQTIDGHQAKIVTPKVVGQGITGVYFDDLDDNNRLVLYGTNLTAAQQAVALKIFPSVIFIRKTIVVKVVPPTYYPTVTSLSSRTACTDTPEGTPVITSLSSYTGPVGTKLEIRGCNFAGFEGEIDVWIKNSLGVKGLLTAEASSTSKLLKVTLQSPLCQHNTSYSGLPCNAWLTLAPGKYQVYTMALAKKSNEATFTVAPVVKKRAQPTLAQCLPAGITLGAIVSATGEPVVQQTVEQKLNELKAKCDSKNKLVDAAGKQIVFFRLQGCWGRPPNNYLDILQKQQDAINKLKLQYTVVEMTCNPSGIPRS